MLWRANGSSPLTRGKLPGRRNDAPPHRLIPAHAGKTRNGVSPASHAWAHPHSRGENHSLNRSRRRRAGSSPLTRGKPAHRVKAELLRGLIPTHAGKTRGRGEVAAGHGAHPHSRGENLRASIVVMQDPGSSPLTRGKRADDGDAAALARLIPTHAGKTEDEYGIDPMDRAHPHSYGETRRRSRRRSSGKAHPRSRGENVMSHAATFRR